MDLILLNHFLLIHVCIIFYVFRVIYINISKLIIFAFLFGFFLFLRLSSFYFICLLFLLFVFLRGEGLIVVCFISVQLTDYLVGYVIFRAIELFI